MGTGYTRNDTLNNIADGNVINASDLDGEFDAVESAFNETTGHTHDGTAAEGAPITVLGPVQDFIASATEIKPKTTNTLDIGTNSLQFKDMYLDGTAYIDGLGEDILVATDKKIQFRDTALFINSSADGQLDIDADVELELVAPTIDIDASTAITIDTTTLTITGSANVAGDLDVDNININGNTISSTNTNGNITLAPNGTGVVALSSTDLTFGDNDKAIFGAGSDLQIYHNGSASAITDAGSGDLFLGGDNNVLITNAALNETKAKFISNAGVALYYDNNQKFVTTSTGVDVTGGLNTTGNVGIANSSPSQLLHIGSTSIASGSAAWQQIQTNGNNMYVGIGTNNAAYIQANGEFKIATGGYQDSVTVDSSGNLLVGKTSIGLSTTGIDLRSTGLLQAIRDGGTVVELNRQTSDGTIIDLRKDNTTVGSIGNLSTSMYISGSTSQAGILFNGTSYEPTTNGSGRVDNSIDIGSGTYRYKDLYLSGGVYLGGTGAVNYLDDYEEGAWTPVLSGATTTTYTSQIGKYTKVGELVYVFFDIQINSLGNGSATTVVGLPFPQYNNDALAVSYWTGLAVSPYFVAFQIGTGPQALAVGTTAAGSAIQNGMAIFQNGSRIIASGCYRTSS